MKLTDVQETIRQKKGDSRRTDLYRTARLDTWLLYFPPGDVQEMHNHPSDRTYFVVTGRGVIKGPNEIHELSPGMIISIPAFEYYEGSNPYDEPMVLLGNSNKPLREDVLKLGGQRSEVDPSTGKQIVFQHGGGKDSGDPGKAVG